MKPRPDEGRPSLGMICKALKQRITTAITMDTRLRKTAGAALLLEGFSGRSRLLSYMVGFVLAATTILLLVWLVDTSRLWTAGSELLQNPGLLAIFLAVYSAAFWLRAIAWHQVLGSVGTLKLFGILQTALFANHILPFKGGDLVRPILVAKQGVPLADAAVTTALVRLLDVSSLVIIASLFVVLGPSDSALGLGFIALPILMVVLVSGGFLWLRTSQDTSRFPTALAKVVDSARGAVRSIPASRIALAALWTAPSWVLEAGVILVAAHTLGLDLSIDAAIAVTAITILFQTFPITPGGLGTYEATMTGALSLQGMPANEALTLAVFTHSLKFVYSCSVGLAFALIEGKQLLRIKGLGSLRGSASDVKAASRFEIVVARLWNLINEGKPFTPIFVLTILLLLSLPTAFDGGYWLRAGVALVVLLPLFLVFFRYDFPLKLRAALWVYLPLFGLLFWFVDPTAIILVMVLYFSFTVGLWGTVYYHLRIGTPWTNFSRFWRLVLENPDPTSGNFLEQAPKVLLLVLMFQYLVDGLSWGTVGTVELFILGIGISALLIHQWFFTWVPPSALAPTRLRNGSGIQISKRFIAIVIDGCRADRLLEANTPFIDRLRTEGIDFPDMSTVYPARTVTCFSSMLTGAPTRVHGMGSNFVPSLGVKCDSVFTALSRQGLEGRLVGIAHLIDAFGHEDVKSVTAVTHNDEIDLALAARGKQVMLDEDPDLLVLQLLSVDQTGHARGSYNREYLEKIETSDRIIEDFLGWCGDRGYLEDATILITADHGQGIGIGGHGHMSPTEIHVPCILWGKGVEPGCVDDSPRSVMDIAPTISYFLGIDPPEQSVGQVLVTPNIQGVGSESPLAVVIPAKNEAQNLPGVLSMIPRGELPELRIIVVDDGSTDGTAEVAYAWGADVVVRHEVNRGLGAALRTGLATARDMGARAAVYLDADGEYDPREIPNLLAPIQQGKADYVLGSRYRGTRRGQPLLRLAGNLVFTSALCILAGRRITDGQTGFRAFSARALGVAEIIHDYNYAQVLTLDLLHKGMRMVEVPITYRYRGHGRSFVNAQYLWRVPWGIARELLQG